MLRLVVDMLTYCVWECINNNSRRKHTGYRYIIHIPRGIRLPASQSVVQDGDTQSCRASPLSSKHTGVKLRLKMGHFSTKWNNFGLCNINLLFILT